MRKNRFVFFLIGFFGFALFFFVFLFYPLIYDSFYGKEILNQHIREVINNSINSEEIATLLLNWIHLNIYYPLPEEKIFDTNLGVGLYKINNKTLLFYRSPPVSWTIKTKLGRCGEDAQYFVQVMNLLGYKSRMISMEGWDHAWAEYFTQEGYKITVNPSGNSVINIKEWFNGKNITRIIARYPDGKIEDITPEYKDDINNSQ